MAAGDGDLVRKMRTGGGGGRGWGRRMTRSDDGDEWGGGGGWGRPCSGGEGETERM